jgi:hypothetical protein
VLFRRRIGQARGVHSRIAATVPDEDAMRGGKVNSRPVASTYSEPGAINER